MDMLYIETETQIYRMELKTPEMVNVRVSIKD